MQLEELDYSLPRDLIADRPVEPRDACRLMVVHRKTGKIEHKNFRNLQDYLTRGDLLVLNSARVLPARLLARMEGSESAKPLEILVTDADDTPQCRALIKPSRKVRTGMRLSSEKRGAFIRTGCCNHEKLWELELEENGLNWRKLLEAEGHMPLPPYILKRRPSKSDGPEDRVWYQTAFADRDGAIAAPTAGLHFSREILEQLERGDVDVARIFLKVGIGTFLPVRTSRVENHVLIPEEFEIGEEAARKIRTAQDCKGRIIAVGTTVVRALEFCASEEGTVSAQKGATDLLILPPYLFQVVGGLITNFHLPKSTLMMLISAFAGKDLIFKAYQEAINQKYRFFSFGDAMLIL